MLGEMLKERINEVEQKELNEISKEDAKLRNKQLKQLEDFQTIISHIKKGINELANGKRDIKNTKLGLYITGLNRFKKELNSNYDFHHQYAEKDFFDAYEKFHFNAEMNEFKKWLKENGIKAINTSSQHDGCGIDSWVDFYAIV